MSNLFKLARELEKKLEKDLIDISYNKVADVLYDISGKLKYKASKSNDEERSNKLKRAAHMLDGAIEIIKYL